MKPQENVNGQNTKWLSMGERWVSNCVCVQTWITGDPLPGHRASSTPGCAVGAVVGRPWPASPGCSPPAGAPGPGCPFPRCAAAVAASSPARAACAAQPSDWTSRQRETSSANTHSEQPCRHDNLSIHRSIQPFFVLFLLPLPSTGNTHVPNHIGEIGRKEGKKARKVFPLPHIVGGQHDVMCLHLACSPALPPLLPIAQTSPQCPTPLSLQICPPRPILRSAYKRAVSVGYACKLVGVSHLAAVTTRCPMLCAWQHAKIGLGVDDDDHYKPELEREARTAETLRITEKMLNDSWYCFYL